MLTINGWAVLAHPLFLDQWEKLIDAVDALKEKKPEDYQKSADAKLLAALSHLVTVAVPSDPTAAIYRQGSALGDDRKHWFRAKFGNGRFRLFFRYSSASKILIFAWVNDANTLRTYGPGPTPTRCSRECWTMATRPTIGTCCTAKHPTRKPLSGWEKPLPRKHEGQAQVQISKWGSLHPNGTSTG